MISAVDVKPALNEPTYGRVRDRIREEILAGVFKPGERLRTQQLADRYQVSPMPIREALQNLQGEGLVELVPNRGASVRRFDTRSVANLYDIRGAIESMLTSKAAAIISEADLEVLEDIQHRYEQMVQDQNLGAAMKLNTELHRRINGLAENEEAMQIIERHWGLIHALRRRYAFGPGRIDETVREHRALIDALRKRDVQMAAQLALAHCESAKQDLVRQMERLA